MADITTLNGNLLLKTEPTNPNAKLTVSRTDAGATKPLAQIKMFGEGTNNFQGVMAFETMNSGSSNGPLEERMRIHTNGNVGIGTVPGDKLDVNGDIRIRGANIKDAGGTVRITLTDNGRLDLKEDGGNTALSIDTAGKVGIGTTSPQANLDVRGTITTSGSNIELTQQASGNRYSYIDFHGDDIYTDYGLRVIRYNTGANAESSIHHRGTGILRLYTQESGSHIVLQPSGNVGIGTSAPGAKLSINGGLHVGGDSDPGNDNLLVDGDIAISGKHAFRGSDSWLRLNQDKAFTSGVHTPGVFAPMSLNVGGAGGWGDPGRGNVWITGNVGIGTPSPKAKLDVRGNITTSGSNIELTQQASGNRYSYIDFHGDDTYTDYGLRVIRYNIGANAESRIHHRGTGILRLYTQESGSHIVLQPRGYVGIGTIDPKEKLEINGSIRGNQSGALRISTGYGYMDVGPKNSGWSHFITDRSKYYFNKEIRVSSGKIGSYAEDLSLCTSGTERIRVKRSNGNVGIGTLQPSDKLHVAGSFIRVDGAGQEQAYIGGDGWGSDIQIGSHNANIMNVGMWNTAKRVHMKVYALDFIRTSDLRYKMNIQTISNALDKTLKLRGVMYNDRNQVESKDLDSGSEHKIGLIGQEVEEIVPQVVFRDKKGFYSISYTSIIPLLIEAMKEQQKMIEELKDTIISDIKGDSRT